jgi:hypothetical protein
MSWAPHPFSRRSDREEEYKQKCKWKLKTKSKFYLDRERTREVFTLVTKGKGKARRDIKFITNTDAEGKEFTVSSVSQKVKVKKMVYHLIPTGTDVRLPEALVVCQCGCIIFRLCPLSYFCRWKSRL